MLEKANYLPFFGPPWTWFVCRQAHGNELHNDSMTPEVFSLDYHVSLEQIGPTRSRSNAAQIEVTNDLDIQLQAQHFTEMFFTSSFQHLLSLLSQELEMVPFWSHSNRKFINKSSFENVTVFLSRYHKKMWNKYCSFTKRHKENQPPKSSN